MNAVTLDNAVVGEQAVVAAGSVVTDGMEIPARHLAAGSPARPGKELSGTFLWWVEQSSKAYVELLKATWRRGLERLNVIHSLI